MVESTGPFQKSSYSAGEGNCVEVADIATHGRAVRDSKHPEDGDGAPLLVVSREGWRGFLSQF
ncbi:DUF397 domain-containing protein [Streptomyces sp. NPDC088196]|uniref:DUF397 domain-containing protein n=1 Tax=Streptomyces sp. NPDC088196 TaxID=3154868 RepID=UPI003450D7D5